MAVKIKHLPPGLILVTSKDWDLVHEFFESLTPSEQMDLAHLGYHLVGVPESLHFKSVTDEELGEMGLKRMRPKKPKLKDQH